MCTNPSWQAVNSWSPCLTVWMLASENDWCSSWVMIWICGYGGSLCRRIPWLGNCNWMCSDFIYVQPNCECKLLQTSVEWCFVCSSENHGYDRPTPPLQGNKKKNLNAFPGLNTSITAMPTISLVLCGLFEWTFLRGAARVMAFKVIVTFDEFSINEFFTFYWVFAGLVRL